MKHGKIECRYHELVAISDLKPHPKNPNKHSKDQLQQYRLIMRENGVRQPVRVSKQSGYITKGHGQIMAAKLEGWTHVPVEYQDYERPELEFADLTADNALARQSELDLSVINIELPDLGPDFNIDLLGIANFVLDPSEKDGVPQIGIIGKEYQRVEQVPLSKLKPHPLNYRNHPPDQLQHMVESIKQFGIYKNIVTANDYTILTGHGLYAAARETGLKSLPVKRLEWGPDDTRSLKILTNDNELGHFAEIDDRTLTNLLKNIKDNDPFGLLGTGYDEMMLANLVLVTRHENEIKDINEASQWVGMPEFQPQPEPPKIIVSFANEEDKKIFCSMIGLNYSDNKSISTWFPIREREPLSSLKFIETKKDAEA